MEMERANLDVSMETDHYVAPKAQRPKVRTRQQTINTRHSRDTTYAIRDYAISEPKSHNLYALFADKR
jgi:hypothetical protein